MLTSLISRLVIVVFGVMHPAYRSYKALRYKEIKELVRVVMYWVSFGAFTTIETFTDIFLSWLPFYSELKILIILWLSLPYFQGSTFIYRKLIHPHLERKEREIDKAIDKAADKGYSTFLEFGAKGLQYAATTVVNTAILSSDLISNQLRTRSQSMTDLSLKNPALGGDGYTYIDTGSLNRRKIDRPMLHQVPEMDSDGDSGRGTAKRPSIAQQPRQQRSTRRAGTSRNNIDSSDATSVIVNVNSIDI